MKWLETLFPQITVARLIGYAVAVLVLVGLLAFAFLTIKGWRDDSLALPGVKHDLAAAQAAKAALDTQMTGRMTDISNRLQALDTMRDDLAAALAGNRAQIASDLADFKRRFPNGSPQNPACPVSPALRDGLRNLFPAKPAGQPRADGGDGKGGPAVGAPGPAGRVDAVPGRQRAADAGRQLGVPAATGPGTGAGDGQPVGYRLGGDHRFARGDEPPLPAAPVGLAAAGGKPGWLARTRTGIANVLRVVGQALLLTAQDDKGDA